MSEGGGKLPLPFEPYKIKVVERLPRPDRATREAAIRRAGYNLFRLQSDEVTIDLLTDSGTGAMSDRQWSALMLGDETYAGSRNFAEFESTVRDITGFPFVLPTHQGRAAEHLLFTQLAKAGTIVPNNMHFDTTRAHVVRRGARAVNLAIPEAYDPESQHPFKGNMDLGRLQAMLTGSDAKRVPMVMMTLTNNAGAGQPVSMENLTAVSGECRKAGIPLYLDMCRWAENAYFIREREPGFAQESIARIGQLMFELAEGATMSAKKDGLVNIGGFVATRDPALAERLVQDLILFEGFPTYGGLARRDLAAMAVGLREAMDLEYLEHRVAQVRFLARLLDRDGIPYFRPPGGHGVYLDARRFFPHLPDSDFPGQTLAIELYREGGVRSVEVGRVMFGEGDPGSMIPPLELVRLAIPRRVFTASHLTYVAEVIRRVFLRRATVQGVRMKGAAGSLAHFTASFELIRSARAPEATPGSRPLPAGIGPTTMSMGPSSRPGAPVNRFDLS